jgi:deoxyribonuclease V
MKAHQWRTRIRHRWKVSPEEARLIQESLRHKVVFRPLNLRNVRTVAGLDQSYHPTLRNRVFGVAVVFSFPDLQINEVSIAESQTIFPYVPGLLSFRETPVLLKALKGLKRRPDVIIADAQGYAHPRRFGAASHVGVLTGIPTVGCAKSRLIGLYDEPGPNRGSWSALVDGDETIGAVVRTRDRVAPVFVSVGHLVDLPSAIALVLATTSKYRIPEPIRAAHNLSNLARASRFSPKP